ncbi:MAG: hypothetical protein LBH81_03395 [Rickettsiales bacterium]|jgi:hypothetical protein|nr:hypothetical protein [Rickettsiales bacterium]
MTQEEKRKLVRMGLSGPQIAYLEGRGMTFAHISAALEARLPFTEIKGFLDIGDTPDQIQKTAEKIVQDRKPSVGRRLFGESSAVLSDLPMVRDNAPAKFFAKGTEEVARLALWGACNAIEALVKKIRSR